MLNVFSLILMFTLLFGSISGAAATVVDLENVNFTQQELQDIARTNSIINNYIARLSLARSGSGKVLSMTVIQQENWFYCGPATAVMVAETLGLGTYTQKNMAKILGTTSDGSSSSNITTGLNSLLSKSSNYGRYQTTNVSKSNLSNSIVASINNDFPVVINVKDMPEYSVSVGHFIAAYGYVSGSSGSMSINNVYICDPHPDFFGTYTYPMQKIVDTCSSGSGNFCRKA